MVDILPIPSELYFLHGILKLLVAVMGLFLLVLTIRKHLQKHSRISFMLIVVYSSMILGMMFASFDDILGWDNLLGPGTWVGFGLGQIFNSISNICYLALYIE